MADQPRSPDMRDDTEPGPGAERDSGTPRWVKVFGIIGIAVIALIVVLMFAGGGQHGPGRHVPGGDTSGVEEPQQEAPGGAPDQGDPAAPGGGHTPPAGGHG